MREIAIISIGAANHIGADTEELFKNLELSQDDPINLAKREQIHLWDKLNIPPRLLKKIDRFSALAIHVCHQILSNQEIPMNMEELRSTGIFVGNVYGGWSYALPYMEQLYQNKEENYQALNPYIATSWFPTAVQGEISILYQMLGNSKTFSAGNLSSGYSIIHGMDEIRMGKLDFSFVGGSEVLPVELDEKYHITKKVNAACNAAFLLLQDAGNATLAGRAILCYIKDYAYGDSFTESMNRVLSMSTEKKIDAIISTKTDTEELCAIKAVFLDNEDIKIYDINSYFGNLYGSQVAMQILLAIYIMRQKSSGQNNKRQVIVNAKDSNGTYLSILLASGKEKGVEF